MRLFGVLAAFAALLCALLLALGGGSRHAPSAEANHAWTHGQGSGFDGIGNGLGWVELYVNGANTTKYTEAIDALDGWRNLHYESLWWFQHTLNADDVNGSSGGATVIDRGAPSVTTWYDYYFQTVTCSAIFDPAFQNKGDADDAYATTIVTDPDGAWRGTDASGFWQQRTGVPFHHATVCLNTHHTNNAGTIAHELGHVLGLDHPAPDHQPCADTGRRTIMAYNYLLWQSQWPALAGYPQNPTDVDKHGPWVCDGVSGGGLAWVYPLGGESLGYGTYTPTPTITPTPTRTPTPTWTPTPTNTPTPTATPVDIDGDGYLNPQQLLHLGPRNTQTAFDNCPLNWNQDQLNTDGNFIDLHPYGKTIDDLTAANSDAIGNACDNDIDNDGLSNVVELSDGPGGANHANCPGATGNTNLLLADTDGDGVLDGAECAMGTDPLNAASNPSQFDCAAHLGVSITTDTDGDHVRDAIEYCGYNTSTTSANSDGDGCGDAREIASIDGNQTVNSTDLQQVATAFGPSTSSAYILDFDMDKNGDINSSDLQFVAAQFAACAP